MALELARTYFSFLYTDEHREDWFATRNRMIELTRKQNTDPIQTYFRPRNWSLDKVPRAWVKKETSDHYRPSEKLTQTAKKAWPQQDLNEQLPFAKQIEINYAMVRSVP